MIKPDYLYDMTTSTIDIMNSLGDDLAKFQINNTQISNFVELVKGGPVSSVALEVLADNTAVEVVRVRAFARVSADLRKAI
jgi:rRNA processing protein Krr1/Pno1